MELELIVLTRPVAGRSEIIRQLRNRLAAAKKRARYWTGYPSSTGAVFAARGGICPGQRYHEALAEVAACSRLIGKLTGRCPGYSDVRAASAGGAETLLGVE